MARASGAPAPMGMPPGMSGAGEGAGDGCEGGGDGGDGGGGGGEGGVPASHGPKVNAEMPDMEHVNLSRLFDDTVAPSAS